MKMPYVVGPPVRLPTNFFGRQRQTRQFFETLAGAQMQCVSVLGLRRAGKTSFLQYISHPEVMAGFLPDPHRYLMVYVDVSACKTPAEFYSRVYRKLLSGLPRVPVGVDRSGSEADVYDVESLLYEFGDRQVVLLMDEFDQIRSADFSGDFLSELRALAGVWDYQLAYVTASYWDNFRLGNFVGLSPTSPFYNIFFPTPIYLSGLSPTELDELVKVPASRVGIQADDEDVAFIRYHAGTLPFFVQVVAAVWLTFKAQGRQPDPRELNERLVSEMWPYFEQWWSNFSDVERDVATAVAQEKAVTKLPYNEQDIAQASDRLKCYGVIASAGNNLWSDSALFGRWLMENKGRAKRNTANPAASAARSAGGRGDSTPDRAVWRTNHSHVLRIITDIGSQFARLPAVYAPKSDEDLRNHLMLALESGLPGVGGSFNLLPMGKTELLVRQDGLNVVATSCTTWMGQKLFLRAVDQLLGTLTVHNSCAVAVVLVRNQEYGLVGEAITQAMPHHAGYLGYDGRAEGRLDYRLHINGDPHSEVALSILLFHLHG